MSQNKKKEISNFVPLHFHIHLPYVLGFLPECGVISSVIIRRRN